MANWVLEKSVNDTVVAARKIIAEAKRQLRGSWKDNGIEWLQEPFAVIGKEQTFDVSPWMLKLYKKNKVTIWKEAASSILRTFDDLSFAFARTTLSLKDSNVTYVAYVCVQIYRSHDQNIYRYGFLVVSHGMLEDKSSAMALCLKLANNASKPASFLMCSVYAAVFCLMLSLLGYSMLHGEKSREKQQMLATYEQLTSEDNSSHMSDEDRYSSMSDAYSKVLKDIDAKFPNMCGSGKSRLATYVLAARQANVEPIIYKHYCKQLSRAIDVLFFTSDWTSFIIDFKFSNPQENLKITLADHNAFKTLKALVQKIHEPGSQWRD